MRGGSLSGGGGAERRFARVAQEARRKGYEVVLIVNRELAEGLNRAQIIETDDPMLCTPPSKLSVIAFNQWLVRTVRELKPDIIHLPLIQRSLIPFYAWLGVYSALPVVQTIATSQLMDRREKTDQRLLVHFLMQRATLVDVLYPRFSETMWAQRY